MRRPAWSQPPPLAPDLHDRLLLGATARIVITGAGGQLGVALAEAFAGEDVVPLTRADWDVERPYPKRLPKPDVVLHAAAWTDVDGAEREPAAAYGANAIGTSNVVAIGAPVVYFSSDYVFDGWKGSPYRESDPPAPLSVYGRSKLAGEHLLERGWIVRSSWLFGWTGRNFVRTMLALGAERNEVAVVDDQRGSPTFVGHLAAAVRELLERPEGVWHLAPAGEASWADFAEAIFAETGLVASVRRISTDELGRPAPRPACSVLRSERVDAPSLPDWREGLRACLDRLSAAS